MLIVTVNDSEEVVLTRDGVQLGRITVCHRGDGRIRLGLDFPRDIRILRGELLKQREDADE